MTSVGAPRRARVRARGLVQGVGYRPFACALAARHGLSGWVSNDEQGVVLEAQGDGLGGFLRDLAREAPPLARVEAVEVEAVPAVVGEGPFCIRASSRRGAPTTDVPPDAALCRACLVELFDPGDRRYLHPFIHCTHCGPRHAIARAVPYDRERTSMAAFPLCDACRREHDDPTDRRFHAQAIACPRCGPRLAMPFEEIARRLLAGQIVALAGVGGYHLACDARREDVVAELRRRKDRDGKPFAVMGLNAASLARWSDVTDVEWACLDDVRRPVVLCRAREDSPLAPSVAPGLTTVGAILPYTPLHHLLFFEAAGRPSGTAWLDEPLDVAFVMTSANRSGEPLVRDDDEARDRLAGVADAIVSHDRAIVVRTDDSVARVVAGVPRLLRRGRGWVPGATRLPLPADGVLALGAQLKNTVCLVRGDRAYVSQHVGDLDDVATYASFRETIDHLARTTGVSPRFVVHDRHPDYLSTRWAEETGLPALAVQHHHAHAAAVLAEHGRTGPALGLVLDGYGLGDDGGAWGGELLAVNGHRSERVGHLARLPLPGFDRAAREPWRMGVAALASAGLHDEAVARWGPRARRLLDLVDRGTSSPLTSSAGRWFDAAAALLGLADEITYEGQAAMLLEARVHAPRVIPDGYRIDGAELDLLPLLCAIRNLSVEEGASAFHGTMARGLVDWTVGHARARGVATVAMAGGCFANRVLAEAVELGLREAGLEPLLPALHPPNDGALSLGQAYVAAHAALGGS